MDLPSVGATRYHGQVCEEGTRTGARCAPGSRGPQHRWALVDSQISVGESDVETGGLGVDEAQVLGGYGIRV